MVPKSSVIVILGRYFLSSIIMKRLGLLFLSLSTVFAQEPAVEFLTGQAARETIGQPTFTAEDVGAPSAFQLGAVQGVAVANNTLFVVDSNLHGLYPPVNNRVLIFNNISQFIYNPTDQIPQGGRCPVCVGTPSVGQASVVLGQPDFATTTDPNLTQSGFRNPTMIASDGKILVLADTDNNRVLIWKTIPTTIDQPADLVLGQKDFVTLQEPPPVNSSSLRGPQGVWIQGTQLFVADTQNSRVMIWNTIPTTNNQPADLVLGEPNFSTVPPSTTSDLKPTASNLFDPVSATSDGQKLYVTDLGHHRVLIWNSIPTQNGQPADVVVGQPNMTTEDDNGNIGTCVVSSTDADGYPVYPAGCPTVVCPSTYTDSVGTLVYPGRCGVTMDTPRFALSDGHRLFVADGGNDRVLVYNSIPTSNGAKADIYLGQPDEFTDQVTSSTDTFRPDANILESAPNTIRTPLALAYDGTNLYVTDPFDLRVMVFTPGTPNIPITGIKNAASLDTYAVGTVSLGGTITAGDTVTITITSPGASPPATTTSSTGVVTTSTTCPAANECYTYTVVTTDTLVSIAEALANLINGTAKNSTPDPNVIATADIVEGSLFVVNLIARQPGLNGNNIGYSATTAASTSTGTPTEVASAAGANLAGGAAATELAPGTLVSIFGTNLADTTATATPDANGNYPTTNFNGVQVYFDGIRAPILSVSPTQINTQLPFEVSGSNGVSAFVRTAHSDGSVTVTNAIGVPVVQENPGIFASPGTDPRAVLAYHTSGNAIALVDIDGSVTAGDVATITIGSNNYGYGVQATDTLQSVRDGFVALINANTNEKVTASVAGEFTRIILTAKVGGPAGNGITISATVSTNATITISPLGDSQTCCANAAGSLVTQDNPVIPGEVITIYATGIGPTTLPDGLTAASITGQVYPGPALNVPVTNVDNAQVGGTTANVLSAGLAVGMMPGVYAVELQIDNTLPTNPVTQMYIAQNVFTSNIVTIPVVAQSPPSATSAARKDNASDRKRTGRVADQPRR
jgi:uncharacterized protein (TIGR03437 family)